MSHPARRGVSLRCLHHGLHALQKAGASLRLMVLTCPVQVRQHTGHKRTFFYLEQLILKYNVDQQCINIKEMHQVQSWAPRPFFGPKGQACHPIQMATANTFQH